MFCDDPPLSFGSAGGRLPLLLDMRNELWLDNGMSEALTTSKTAHRVRTGDVVFSHVGDDRTVVETWRHDNVVWFLYDDGVHDPFPPDYKVIVVVAS